MLKMNLPVIVLSNLVLLPNNDLKLEFEDELSKSIIDSAELFNDGNLLVVSKKNPLEETINVEELPKYGVIAKITHRIELPNNNTRVIITGIARAYVYEYLDGTHQGNIIESIISKVPHTNIEKKQEEILINKLIKEINIYINELPYVSNSILSQIKDIKSLDKITDIVAPYIESDNSKLIKFLNTVNSIERLELIINKINEELENFKIEKELESKVKRNFDESQREFLLREKLKVIKQELGDISIKEDSNDELKEKIEKLDAPTKIKNRLETELRRYESLSNTSPEVNVVRNYIDWLLELPWKEETIDNDDLDDVKEKLDKSHDGLEKVKRRIIEYLAVKQMTNSLRSPIICLVGPPGVGKTSLAFSIAASMGRKFVKISVGGVNDEAEIIGHRRAYLGSSPGRIIQAMKKAGSINPVFLIDEIDKMTKDYKGDPASVLLEILDPEQNKFFSDNYIEEEYDLSKVMFITTANYIENIPEALRDRLEIVELSGYTEYEKLSIARTHLIPKIAQEHGINKDGLVFKDEAIFKIIRSYTKESGVRELERQIASIVRKIMTNMVMKRNIVNKYIIDEKKVKQYLGEEKYFFNKKGENDLIGIVNGLSYTYYDGDVLPIEVTYFKGSGNLILTGNLGEVMKESAQISLDYIKSNYKRFGIDYDILINNDIHIHVPEGAIKKEGPSAGIALTTALISAFTNKRVSRDIAMTGEITLRGNVLPIGGLKEKIIGAHRLGIKQIIIPEDNKKDLEEIPIKVKEDIKIITVKNYEQVYNILNIKEKK